MWTKVTDPDQIIEGRKLSIEKPNDLENESAHPLDVYIVENTAIKTEVNLKSVEGLEMRHQKKEELIKKLGDLWVWE